jgi:predicted RND superfamily exporter protein
MKYCTVCIFLLVVLLFGVYADDVNLLGDNIDTIKKNTEILIDASKEVGLEINVENSVYVAVSSPECRSKSAHKTSKQIV